VTCLTGCQYFLWFMVFLPFYLPTSSMLARPVVGGVASALWILAQVRNAVTFELLFLITAGIMASQRVSTRVPWTKYLRTRTLGCEHTSVPG